MRNLTTLRIACCALAFSMWAPNAFSQSYISPFIGTLAGGDAACQGDAACGDAGLALGAAYGFYNTLIGFEEDFSYLKNLFRDGPGAESRILTLTSNVTIAPLIGIVRPYAVGGFGFIRTKVDVSPSTGMSGEDSDFGWDLGGGLTVSYGHIGIRGDLRRFQGFRDLQAQGYPVHDKQLQFIRASVALVIQ